MITKVALTTLFIHFTIITSFAQLEEIWITTWDSGPSDVARSVCIDQNNNIYVTGKAWNGTLFGGILDIGTVKYNPSGIKIWEVFYDEIYNGMHSGDMGLFVKVDRNNDIYVVGKSDTGSLYGGDIVTIKYNSNGVEQWRKRYDGPGHYTDFPYGSCLDNNGNIFITGTTYGTTNGMDYVTISYDSSGSLRWIKYFNSQPYNSYDESIDILNDRDGNIYITGGASGYGTGSDIVTIKYDNNGNELWNKRFYTATGDLGNVLAIDSLNNIYVGGISFGDLTVLKYSPDGNLIWVYKYNGSGGSSIRDSWAIDMQILSSNYIYVTGDSYQDSSKYDYITLKLTSTGSMIWVKRFNGSGNKDDRAKKIIVDNFGTVYVTGRTKNTLEWTDDDITTLCYDYNGNLLKQVTFNGINYPLSSDIVFDMTIDYYSDLIITGGTNFEDSTGGNYLTIKYSSLIGIQPVSSEIPTKFSLSQNFPNPFNPLTHLRFEISDLRFVKLVIHDILGREITTLVNEQLKPGTYEVEWDASNYPSGVYLYRITTQEFTETKKMILLK